MTLLSLDTLPNIPPREITTDQPVRLVLVGGFLGAGKTTALVALAREFARRGLRVGIITNDQAEHLVDTATVRQAGYAASEVAGGCFCCRFTDLVDAAQEIISEIKPDILLCEPVGSCTDMAATVIAPLRRFYPEQFQIAPFTVLVDPTHVKELVLGEVVSSLAAEAAYIFEKQLEEADEIILNKVDQYRTYDEGDRAADALSARFGKPVHQMSAIEEEGTSTWASRLLENTADTKNILREIDYDTYAAGEAVLGWLNATAEVIGQPAFDPRTVVQKTLRYLQESCVAQSAEIAHIKLALSRRTDEQKQFLRANLASTLEEVEMQGDRAWHATSQATLVLNARVQSTPELLEKMVREALKHTAELTGAVLRIETLQCFSPSYPRPPYRVSMLAEP